MHAYMKKSRVEVSDATRAGEKVAYMSKFAVIFAGADNTQLMRTQPIANLVTVCLQVFPALLLTSLTQCKFLSDSAIVLFRY